MPKDMVIKCNRCHEECPQISSTNTDVPLCLDCLSKRRAYLKEAYEHYREQTGQIFRPYTLRYEVK